MKNLEIKEENKKSFYKAQKLKKLSYEIKKKLEDKKHPSFFEKIKKSILS